MRFGLFYEHQLPRPWSEGDEERLLHEALEQVELADRLGFDHVWEVEHHFLEEYSHSSAPEVFLAAASQRTRDIRLGHGIVQLPPAINHPARVAERTATLDLLSHGRVDLGTGEGSSQAELGAFGVGRDDKREQWREALDVIVRLFTEDPFTGHRGTWIDLPPRNLVPKPKQRPHPPLWMACSRRETIEVAARHGLGALSFSFVEPEDAKPLVDAYHRIIRSDDWTPAGEAVNATIAVTVPFLCHQDEQTAIDRGIDGAHFFGYSLAHYYVFGEHTPGRTDVWREFDAYRHERGFARDIIRPEQQPLGMRVLQQGIGSMRGAVGTPAQVADLIERYEAVGVDQIIFVAQSGRNQHEHVCESLELFAREVLPRFAEGREEREAREREELADAVDRALARREQRVASVDGYAITPEGELHPAPTVQPVHAAHGLDAGSVRRRVRSTVRSVVTEMIDRTDPDRLERVVSSEHTWRVVFAAMARSVDPDATRDVDAIIQFLVVVDGRTLPWAVRVRDGRAAVRPTRVEDPTVTLRASGVDLLRVLSGAEPAGRAVMDERLEVSGDVGLAARLTTLFGAASPY